jgi:putative ABC transport system permease protein
MDRMRKLLFRLFELLRRTQRDAEMEAELRSHIEMQTHENLVEGMSPEQARKSALRQFGWVESIKETCREQRSLFWVEDLVKDIRFGARLLTRNIGFTITTVLTLALGIGSTTTIFSRLNTLLFRPLPFPESQSLLLLSEVWTEKGWGRSEVSLSTFSDWQQQSVSFESMAAILKTSLRVGTESKVDTVPGAEISTTLLDVLKVHPALGRGFLPEERQPGRNHVLLLSYGLWQHRFAGRPDILDAKVDVNGLPYTVVGVMPSGFRFPSSVEVWTPLVRSAESLSRRSERSLMVVGRLKQGISTDQAHAELTAISDRIAKAFPETNRGWGSSVEPLRVLFGGAEARDTFTALFLATIFLLLTACANVANLLLARFESRKKELAVRSSLGAAQNRIIRQLLTETVLLVALGTAAGLALAFWLSTSLGAFLPDSGMAGTQPVFDWRVGLFAVGLCLVCALCIGTIPAWKLARNDPGLELKGLNAATSPARWLPWSGYWIASEVACATILLIGSGLMIRTVANLTRVNLGFEPAPLVLAEVEPIWDRTEPDYSPKKVDYFARLQERLSETPGFSKVAVLRDNGWADYRAESGAAAIRCYSLACSSNLFSTLSVSLISGRSFNERWQKGEANEVVVNETFARRFWPGEDAVQKRFKIADALPNTMWCTVVGVARNFQLSREQADRPAIFFSYRTSYLEGVGLLVRSAGVPTDAVATVSRILREFDPTQNAAKVQTMTQALDEVIGPRNRVMTLLTCFAIVSLAIAIVGIYGVTSYLVGQRRREVGIRLALGAIPRTVRYLMLARGMVPVLAGVLIGAPCSLLLGRLLAHQMFGVISLDPIACCGGIGLMFLASLPACFVPALRASRMHPMAALRCE